MAMKKLGSALYRAGRCSLCEFGCQGVLCQGCEQGGEQVHDNYDEEQEKHAEIFIYPWF